MDAMKENMPATKEKNDMEKLMQSLNLERDCRLVDIRLADLKALRRDLWMEFVGTAAFSVSFIMIAMIAAKVDLRLMAYIAMTAALLGVVHLAPLIRAIRTAKRAWDTIYEKITGRYVPSKEE